MIQDFLYHYYNLSGLATLSTLPPLFGSIVYNRTKVYMHQNFLKVVVHVVIIDQWNKTASLYEIQVTVIYSRAILVTLTSECSLKRVICKTWTGLTHTLQTQIRRRIMWRLIRVCTVFLNYGMLRFKWNNLKSPFRTIFLALLRDNRPLSAVGALNKRQTTAVTYVIFFIPIPFWKWSYSNDVKTGSRL